MYFHFFSGLEYFESKPPCDPTQIGRISLLLGEEGVEELLSKTIQTAFNNCLIGVSSACKTLRCKSNVLSSWASGIKAYPYCPTQLVIVWHDRAMS